MVGPQLGLVAPLVPVEPCGNRLGQAGRPAHAGLEVEGDDGEDLADRPLAHQLAGVLVDRHEALLRPDLEHPVVFLHRTDQVPALGHRERHRLLAVDVAAGLEHAGDGQNPGVGRGLDEDGVELLLLEHRPVILVELPLVAAGNELGGLMAAGKKAIGAGNDLAPGRASPVRSHRARPPRPIKPSWMRSLAPGRPGAARTLPGTTEGNANVDAVAATAEPRSHWRRFIKIPFLDKVMRKAPEKLARLRQEGTSLCRQGPPASPPVDLE